MSFKINWEGVADRILLRRLARLADIRGGVAPAGTRALVVKILESTGGFPYVDARIAPSDIAEQVLHSAVKHVLSGLVSPNIKVRYHLTPGTSPWLVKRVAPRAVSPSLKRPDIVNDFSADFRTLVDLQDERSARSRMLSALRMLAAETSTPNPFNEFAQARPFSAARLPGGRRTEMVGHLFGREYHDWLTGAIAGATRRINVAMFHIALGSETHPTRRLVDALASRARRGVKVRVLLDKDRATDPYLSTIINAPAHRYLAARGVELKDDRPGSLLHSKFVTIDDGLSVIGSHNWTSGSLFGADDLSVAIRSRDFNRDLCRRFEKLWRS